VRSPARDERAHLVAACAERTRQRRTHATGADD
jgi:hypothetical protein